MVLYDLLGRQGPREPSASGRRHHEAVVLFVHVDGQQDQIQRRPHKIPLAGPPRAAQRREQGQRHEEVRGAEGRQGQPPGQPPQGRKRLGAVAEWEERRDADASPRKGRVGVTLTSTLTLLTAVLAVTERRREEGTGRANG